MSVTRTIPSKVKAERIVKLFEEKFKQDPLRFKALPGVTSYWTPQKIVKLYAFTSNPCPELEEKQEFAESVGINSNNCTRKANLINWILFEETLEYLCSMSCEDAVKHEAKKEQVKQQTREKGKVRSKLITREAFYTNLEQRVLEACQNIKVELPPVTLNRAPKASEAEHVVLLLSDLHVGQEFRLEETGEINAYNIDIFKQRAANLKKALIEIVQLHSKLYKMPELHIFALGDNVQGGRLNGEWGGAYTGHYSVTDQAVIAAKTMGCLINEWSRYFQKIHFMGVVGNHGRGGVTKESDEVSANWDNVTYIALNGEMAHNPKVDVKWSKTWWSQINILGTEFMLVHGDYFTSSINALLTANQKLHDLVAGIHNAKPFNVLCTGHFHRYTEIETSMGRILVNGSFVGADMYSLHQMRAACRPTQTIFGVNGTHGITWRYPLDLEKQRP